MGNASPLFLLQVPFFALSFHSLTLPQDGLNFAPFRWGGFPPSGNKLFFPFLFDIRFPPLFWCFSFFFYFFFSTRRLPLPFFGPKPVATYPPPWGPPRPSPLFLWLGGNSLFSKTRARFFSFFYRLTLLQISLFFFTFFKYFCGVFQFTTFWLHRVSRPSVFFFPFGNTPCPECFSPLARFRFPKLGFHPLPQKGFFSTPGIHIYESPQHTKSLPTLFQTALYYPPGVQKTSGTPFLPKNLKPLPNPYIS